MPDISKLKIVDKTAPAESVDTLNKSFIHAIRTLGK
jgi:hypothetical protein